MAATVGTAGAGAANAAAAGAAARGAGIAGPQKIACIDLGLKRIGCALATLGVAVPCEPIARQNRKQAAAELSAWLAEQKVNVLLIGVPEGGSAEAEFRRRAEHFASLLSFCGEIKFVDESFSSRRAAALVGSRRAGKKTGRQDSTAALLVLQDFLGI